MFKLVVTSPYKEIYNLEAKKLITQSIAGKIEILSNHSTFLTVLSEGVSQFEDSNGKVHSFNNSRALMKVTKDKVIILCEDVDENKDLA